MEGDELLDLMDRKARQKEELEEQLDAAPIDEIAGIVDAFGAFGGDHRIDGVVKSHTVMFTLASWRDGQGTTHASELQVRRFVDETEMSRVIGLVNADKIVRLRARVLTENVLGIPCARFEEYVGELQGDAELEAIRDDLVGPKTFEDSRFGAFRLDRRSSWWEGWADWEGVPVKLHLDGKERAEADACLAHARKLWDAAEEWNRRVVAFAVSELLPLKNDCWLDEDESEVVAGEFVNRMKLESITVRKDGSFEFWHQDGDLFWGHSIEVSGTLRDGPTRADIPG